MNIGFWDEGCQLTAEDVGRAEQRIGAPIPAEYRTFLLAHNGGKPEPDGFWIYQADKITVHDWSKITRFNHIGGGDHHDLERCLRLMKDVLPPKLFPIADDVAGNYICISTASSGMGELLYWNHEYDDDAGRSRSIFYLAPSFDVFLDRLTWDVGDE